MKALALLLLIMTLLCPPAFAESVAELALLQEFFSPKGMENRSSKLTGEALEEYSRRPLVGEYLSPQAVVDFRLLFEDETSAVYEAVVAVDGSARSWSAFFQRTPVSSRLAAIKTLLLPPFLDDVEYKGLRAQKGRSVIQERRFRQLQRLFMTTAALKEEFNQKRPEYEALARAVETGKSEEAAQAVKEAALVGVRLYGASKSEGEMALLSGVDEKKGGKSSPQLGSEVRISGFLESVVGLLHLPPGVTPPPLSAHDYILVEPLDENWFLFRNIAATPLVEKSAKNE